MARLTVGWTAAVLDAELLQGRPETELGEPVIDSRQAGPGTTFWALPGEQTDGHQFVVAALQAGAAGVVVDRAVAVPPDAGFVLKVADVKAALRDASIAWRRGYTAPAGRTLPVWAVTGSNGKTATKEMLAWLLGRQYPVLASSGNRNNDLGVPLTLLQLNSEHRALVIELGMNHAGELAELASWVRPTAAVITNVAASHMEFFESLDAIADAKAELADALPAGAPLVVNSDDPRTMAIAAARPRLRRVTFGCGPDADYRVEHIEVGAAGSAFSLHGRRVSIPVTGRHQVMNAAAALAALGAQGLPVPEGELCTGLRMSGRMEQREIAGVGLLVDCYNANPFSTAALLETLPAVSRGRRVIFVFGDMLELGASGVAEHRRIGALAAAVVDVFITAGDLAAHAAAAAEAAGHHRVVTCADAAAAGEAAAGSARPGDLVVLKASHGMHLEKVVERFCGLGNEG